MFSCFFLLYLRFKKITKGLNRFSLIQQGRTLGCTYTVLSVLVTPIQHLYSGTLFPATTWRRNYVALASMWHHYIASRSVRRHYGVNEKTSHWHRCYLPDGYNPRLTYFQLKTQWIPISWSTAFTKHWSHKCRPWESNPRPPAWRWKPSPPGRTLRFFEYKEA